MHFVNHTHTQDTHTLRHTNTLKTLKPRHTTHTHKHTHLTHTPHTHTHTSHTPTHPHTSIQTHTHTQTLTHGEAKVEKVDALLLLEKLDERVPFGGGGVVGIRGGHFRHFLSLSLVKNDFSTFFIRLITNFCTGPFKEPTSGRINLIKNAKNYYFNGKN